MDFKEVWSFKSSNSGKWSEIYYSQGASLAAVATFHPNFIADRLALLHPLNTLRKIRISQVDAPRVTTIVNINRPGTSGVGVNGNGPANVADAAVCNLASTVIPCSRRLWLRGFGERDVFRNPDTGNDVLNVLWRNALDIWIGDLSNPANKYEILPISKEGQDGVLTVRVVSVDGTHANGQTVLTCTAPPNVIAKQQVILSRFSKKDFPALNGRFTVLAVAGNTITIPYATPENALLIPLDGYCKKLHFQTGAFINPGASGFSYFGSRKTKNDNTGSRGSARAQRIRLLA